MTELDGKGYRFETNPKTATVQLTTGGIWRVPYVLLFDVLEGQTQPEVEDGVLIESTALDAHDDAEPPR